MGCSLCLELLEEGSSRREWWSGQVSPRERRAALVGASVVVRCEGVRGTRGNTRRWGRERGRWATTSTPCDAGVKKPRISEAGSAKVRALAFIGRTALSRTGSADLADVGQRRHVHRYFRRTRMRFRADQVRCCWCTRGRDHSHADSACCHTEDRRSASSRKGEGRRRKP